jgi:molybdenum-dependent DNA-binding transcriptional regulator ModE
MTISETDRALLKAYRDYQREVNAARVKTQRDHQREIDKGRKVKQQPATRPKSPS